VFIPFKASAATKCRHWHSAGYGAQKIKANILMRLHYCDSTVITIQLMRTLSRKETGELANGCLDKKLSCHRDTARCFESL